MELPLTGGCQCGALRWEVRRAPVTFYACHCSQCRRQSGSAHGLSLIVPAEGFVVVRGAAAAWSRPAAGGGEMVCRFCPACGARAAHLRAGRASVKAGGLDDPGALRLAGRIWTEGAPDWALGGEGLLIYPRGPGGLEALAGRFRALNGL